MHSGDVADIERAEEEAGKNAAGRTGPRKAVAAAAPTLELSATGDKIAIIFVNHYTGVWIRPICVTEDELSATSDMELAKMAVNTSIPDLFNQTDVVKRTHILLVGQDSRFFSQTDTETGVSGHLVLNVGLRAEGEEQAAVANVDNDFEVENTSFSSNESDSDVSSDSSQIDVAGFEAAPEASAEDLGVHMNRADLDQASTRSGSDRSLEDSKEDLTAIGGEDASLVTDSQLFKESPQGQSAERSLPRTTQTRGDCVGEVVLKLAGAESHETSNNQALSKCFCNDDR